MALILARSVASRSKSGIALAASFLVLVVIDLLGVNFYSWDDIRNMCALLAVMPLGLRSLVVEATDVCSESRFVLSMSVPSEAAVALVDAYSSESGS
jgi:uncharacterized membrane protein AbrB (regulator of aidB expression)